MTSPRWGNNTPQPPHPHCTDSKTCGRALEKREQHCGTETLRATGKGRGGFTVPTSSRPPFVPLEAAPARKSLAEAGSRRTASVSAHSGTSKTETREVAGSKEEGRGCQPLPPVGVVPPRGPSSSPRGCSPHCPTRTLGLHWQPAWASAAL